MPELLFSYGTLQEEKIQLELFGRQLKGVPDCLHGFKTCPIQIKDESFEIDDQTLYLIAEQSTHPADTIEGTLFELTLEELQLADRYEPAEYKRISVLLASGKAAWIYVRS